jgi:hypothetical protein
MLPPIPDPKPAYIRSDVAEGGLRVMARVPAKHPDDFTAVPD